MVRAQVKAWIGEVSALGAIEEAGYSCHGSRVALPRGRGLSPHAREVGNLLAGVLFCREQLCALWDVQPHRRSPPARWQ